MAEIKVLVITSFGRVPDLGYLYGKLAKLVKIDKHILDKTAQRNLRKSLQDIEWDTYDRVFVDLHFKNIYKQTGYLCKINSLLVYEEDACQNFIPHSKWYGKFSKFYRHLPNARIVVTGASVAQRLSKEGYNVTFLPKGYSDLDLFDENMERDIELGFIGRTASNAYSERKALLENLSARESLQILRTEPGIPYRNMLNRIRFFISADVGLNEYMAKNFEAMACGCVLLAWRQHTEESAIGLEDKKHLLLYSSLDELCELLATLRANSQFAKDLAENGKNFVKSHLSYSLLAEHIANELQAPWPVTPAASRWEKLHSLLMARK